MFKWRETDVNVTKHVNILQTDTQRLYQTLVTTVGYDILGRDVVREENLGLFSIRYKVI
jgi:hypothetical protein